MTSNLPTTKLLLPAPEAADLLSICEKTLWSITAPRGDLACVRIGRRVLYSVDDLRRWIESKKGGSHD
jgi:predicted DNA-binding transcriptional regulator AlpA